jgi:hypothetical protein
MQAVQRDCAAGVGNGVRRRTTGAVLAINGGMIVEGHELMVESSGLISISNNARMPAIRMAHSYAKPPAPFFNTYGRPVTALALRLAFSAGVENAPLECE